MMWGGELVLRDGEAVGQVTSAAWSGDLRGSRGTGLRLAPRPGRRDADWTQERDDTRSTWAAGSQRRSSSSGRLYDPSNERIRS